MKTPLVVLAACVGLAAVCWAGPEVGKPAPDFTLKDLSGKEHKLSDLKGKFVVLEWVNFGCPFVKKHYDTKNMQGLQKEAAGEGVVWLSICSSAPGKQGNETPDAGQTQFKAYDSAAAAYLVDEDGTVGRLYNAKTTPEMFVINPAGDIVYMGAIDNQPTADKSSVEGANNYVKAALTEVLKDKPVSQASTKPYGCSVKYP